jgi:iron complex outermembrane receptor protein
MHTRRVSASSLCILTTLITLTSLRTVAAATTASTATLEEVVVTAQKREDTLQKTGLSIAAISGDTINQQGRNEVTDVLKDVVGLTMTNSPLGNFTFNIRGISSGGSLPPQDADPSAAVNVDGVYASQLVGGPSQLGFYDVARVEVLRGPQGTLYGRNAESGAVNVLTGNPGKEFAANGTLEFGSYSLLRAAGMVNTQINDSWAIRAAFSNINRAGYFTSGGGANVSSSGRVKLQFDNGGAFRLLTGFEYTKVGGTVGVGGMGAGIAAWGLGDPPTDPYDDITKNGGLTGTRPGSFQDNRTEKTWAQLDVDSGVGTLTVVPAHIHVRNTYSVNALFTTGTGAATVRFPGAYIATPYVASGNEDTVEARMVSKPGSRLQWILGGFYLKADNTSVTTNFGGSALSNSRLIVNAKSTAFFGQATYSRAVTTRLIAGLRTTNDKKDFFNSNPGSAGLPPGTPGSGGGSWSRTDYKIGIEHDLSPTSLLYADVATGYRPGSLQTGSASQIGGPGGVLIPNPNLVTKPEYLTAFEIGSKNQFLDNRLRVNADAYYYDYKDRQYTYFTTQAVLGVPCPNGQLPLQFGPDIVCLIELNANKVRMIGAEIETQWLVTPDDELSIAASLLDAKGAAPQIVLLANPNPPPSTPREFQVDINGKTMPNSPKLQLNFSYDHVFHTAAGRFTPRIDVRYQAKTYLQDFRYLLDVINTSLGYREGDKYIQEATTLYDYSLNFASNSDKWSINAYAKNAGNKIYKTITDGSVTTVGTPRTYGVVLSMRY